MSTYSKRNFSVYFMIFTFASAKIFTHELVRKPDLTSFLLFNILLLRDCFMWVVKLSNFDTPKAVSILHQKC